MIVLFFFHGEDALPMLLVDPASAAGARRREDAVRGVRGQRSVAVKAGLEAVVIGGTVIRLGRLGRDPCT